jgi:phosphate transport system substrate-binding protein
MTAALAPVSYDGATTIGFHILPRLEPLYRRVGGSFGPIGDRGTNRGLEAVRAGKADVAGVARDLTPAEKGELACALICHDALGVFVNAGNAVRNLTRAQLKGIFTGRVRSWRELGGPDVAVDPVTEVKTGGRGTVLELRRIALEGEDYGPTREYEDAPDCLLHVARDPAAVTVASMAMAIEGTRAVAIDGVEPIAEQVRAGRYLLGRPMYLVARKPASEAVRLLFEVALAPEGQAVIARSFTPAT